MGKRALVLFILMMIAIAAASSGCAGPKGSSKDGSLVYDDLQRTYIIHFPQGYDSSKPVPLVIVLHGAFSNAKETEVISGMSLEADKEGFIAVYPNGAEKLGNGYMWNIFYNNEPPSRNNVDDIGFLRALIDKLKGSYNIDGDRVYLAGISNGGIMAYMAASRMSDEIAAVAPVAGSAGMYIGDNQTPLEYAKPPRPVPVIAFHGTKDTIMPYQGGEPFTGNPKGYIKILSANESVRLWASYDGCDPTPNVQVYKGATITSYEGGMNGSEVILYSVDGFGHGWPWGINASAKGTNTYIGVPATDIMWKFFQDHPRSQ